MTILYSARRPYPWSSHERFRAVLDLAFGASFGRSLGAILDLARGKRVRAWNKLCLIASRNPRYYERWTAAAEPALVDALLRRGQGAAVPERLACLVLDSARDSEAAAQTIASLAAAFGPNVGIWTEGQSFPHCKMIAPSASPAETLNALFTGSDAPLWLVPVRAGDIVTAWSGRVLAQTVRREDVGDIVYWDNDDISDGPRRNPWIKGEWDPLLYLARDSVSRTCALRGSAVLTAAQRLSSGPIDCQSPICDALPELVMELITEGSATRPTHIPLILTHCGAPEDEAGRWAKLVRRQWPEPVALTDSDVRPFHRVTPPSPQVWPSVSIIIPTRDKVELLFACLRALDRLRYPGAHEIIVVDNGTTQPEALRLLEARRADGSIKVIRDDGPFNFAALNNRAATQATGELLCLLNNDVEALDGSWLTAMVRHAIRPNTGAVGALLLYPDRSVQHAGVAIGTGGAAGHLARGAKPDAPDHFAWHGVTRSVSAVTAACLVVRRDAYFSVGGLDADAFAVAFNDVDFCLRLQQQGLRNVFVAEAVLIHHESVSRGQDHAPANLRRFSGELARFRERWGSAEYQDRHYSPLFSRSAEPCLLAF